MQPVSESAEVAPVSGQRILGEAVFQPDGVDKRVNRGGRDKNQSDETVDAEGKLLID
ncbi:hypothetical protein D3C78_1914290 [compost metagenome]